VTFNHPRVLVEQTWIGLFKYRFHAEKSALQPNTKGAAIPHKRARRVKAMEFESDEE